MSEAENENETADDAEMIDAMNETPDDGEEESPFVAPETADEPEPDDEPEQPETPDPAQPAGMSEKQLEANYKKIERARTTFFNRVSEIMGEDAHQLVECPACAHFVPGLIFPEEFQPDQKLALWPYMGLPDPNLIADAPDRHVCQSCKGRGQVKSGSLVPEYAIVNCRACAGRGYTDDLLPIDAPNGSNGAALPPGDTIAPPMPEDPAWIEAARAAGYTIVPPFAQQGA